MSFPRMHPGSRPDHLAAVLLAGVVAVLAAIILLALSQSDAVLAGATVVLLVAAGIVANTLFRVLGDDGD